MTKTWQLQNTDTGRKEKGFGCNSWRWETVWKNWTCLERWYKSVSQGNMTEGYWLDLCDLSQGPEAGFDLSNKHCIFWLTSKEGFFSTQLAEDLLRGFTVRWRRIRRYYEGLLWRHKQSSSYKVMSLYLSRRQVPGPRSMSSSPFSS
jgi:hypothetical protein